MKKPQKIPCPRCRTPLEPDADTCDGCQRRAAERAALEQRAEFFDRQLNVLAVVKRKTARGWVVCVEFTPKREAMRVGCVREFADEQAAVDRFAELHARALADDGWRVVAPLWDSRLVR